MSSAPARAGALAELAAEAARFGAARAPHEPPPRLAPLARPPDPVAVAAGDPQGQGYVPVAVAPERGNTRPVVPVEGRLHARVAPATLAALDAVVRSWREGDPAALRDLERATLVRIGMALVLADVRAHGQEGAVGEAVRSALDPTRRHTDEPMPDLGRWLARPAGPVAPRAVGVAEEKTG